MSGKKHKGSKGKRDRINKRNPRRDKRGGRKSKVRGQSKIDWKNKHEVGFNII